MSDGARKKDQNKFGNSFRSKRPVWNNLTFDELDQMVQQKDGVNNQPNRKIEHENGLDVCQSQIGKANVLANKLAKRSEYVYWVLVAAHCSDARLLIQNGF